MRLFTAIDLSDEVRANIEKLQSKLKPAARLQWSPAANLHITTKFIGEWPQARLEELTAALMRIPSAGAIEIAVSQIGWYPNPVSPRVLCAGVQAPQALHTLAKATDDAVSMLGVPPERRAYSPHLTLARIRTPQPLTALRDAAAGLEPLEFGSFTATRYHLYLSEPTGAGSVYTKLSGFSLIP
jgi:2'-5' RNA ligase